jgi:hypothetical protein
MITIKEYGPDTPVAAEPAGTPAAFFATLARGGLQVAIPNLSARLGAADVDGRTIPFLVSIDGGGRCYLASFTRTFVDGGADALAKSNSRALKLLAPAVNLGGPFTRAVGLDEHVVLNGNLFATCAADSWTGLDVAEITRAFADRYPAKAIWVRGLVDRVHGTLIKRLEAQGYLIVPARPVEILDPTPADWKPSSNLRKDIKKLGRLEGLAPFVGGPFSAADFETMARLCRLATVQRHSPLMPHYSAAFFAACAGWADCRIVGLRDNSGAIRGFANVVVGQDMIACGTIGYDLQDEHAREIYPALNTLEMQQAIELRRPYNIGFGAIEYKRVRGAVPAMEMGAFHLRHLPGLRRHSWQAALATVKIMAGPVARRL